jgi:LPXTG-site transpeptidase (sortase) family protein
LLAGPDTFEPGQNTQPTGFIPVDVAGLSPAGTLSAATRVRIPSIGVDSAIAPLEVVGEGDDAYYESPVNVVGVIPGTAHPGESGNGWLFGHLESPLRGEGNVFHKLPEIPAMLVSGDPVYISLESATGEYLYQIVSSTVVPQEELQIYETDDATITLVTCSRRPFYDHRQVVTAKLVAYRPA